MSRISKPLAVKWPLALSQSQKQLVTVAISPAHCVLSRALTGSSQTRNQRPSRTGKAQMHAEHVNPLSVRNKILIAVAQPHGLRVHSFGRRNLKASHIYPIA